MRKKKEKQRYSRWLNFSVQKTMVGFERAIAPRMSSHAIPFCLSLFAVDNWVLPKKLAEETKRSNDVEVTFSLSLSFYYRKRRRFFGNTWIGRQVPKKEVHKSDARGGADDERGAKKAYDVVPNELVYWYTFIDDPSCVAVVELVATVTDAKEKVTVAQYGCGWTTMPCPGVSRKQKKGRSRPSSV